MTDLSLHEYKRENMQPYTSKFLNRISMDFSNAIIQLYIEFQKLIRDYNNFNTAANIGLDWLTNLAANLSLPHYYAITGYESPIDSDSITLNKLFGQFYIEERNKESKIGRYKDDTGKQKAYISNKVYKYESGIWVEDTNMKKIIDNTSNIWQELRDEDELYISIAISGSSLENKANIIDVVPFAGTLIKKIEWKTSSGSFEEVLPNSKFPVQIVGDLNFSNELRVLLGGEPRNGKYYYSLRYIDIWRSSFEDDGCITYSIKEYIKAKDLTEINSIEFNSDYIREDLKIKKPIQFRIIKGEEVLCDTNEDAFPLEHPIIIGTLEEDNTLVMEIKLVKKDNITPVIKYINIT